MLVVTTNEIPGKRVKEVKGLVHGGTVRSKHLGRDIGAGLKSIVGGEIRGYSEMMEEARNIALDRMIAEAKKTRSKCGHCHALSILRNYGRIFRGYCLWYGGGCRVAGVR